MSSTSPWFARAHVTVLESIAETCICNGETSLATRDEMKVLLQSSSNGYQSSWAYGRAVNPH